MITLGRRGDLHARRQATAFLRSRDIVHKLFAEVGPRFKDRPGGYSRIIRIGPRPGDAAEMVYLELVDEEYVATQSRSETRSEERTPASAAEAAVPVEAAEEAPETEAEAVEDPEAAAEVDAEAADEADAPSDEAETAEPEADAAPAEGDEPAADDEPKA
jgi:large subunit ribosomal protein L17